MDNPALVIHRYTTPRYLTVNVFLVETPNGVVVVDAATAVSTSREVRAIIDDRLRKPLLGVLLTHGHPDHYVGVGELVRGLDVPVMATQGTIDFAREQDDTKFDSLIRRNYGADAPAQRVFPNTVVRDGDVVTLDGVSFELCDLGACESGADSVWTVQADGLRHLFVGDLVYNHTHCYLRDGHARRWLGALRSMSRELDHTAVLHPAHGDDCGTEMLHWQIGYIEAFLGTLRSLVRDAGGAAAASAREVLVARMQSFLPNDKLLNLLRYELDETIELLAGDRETVAGV